MVLQGLVLSGQVLESTFYDQMTGQPKPGYSVKLTVLDTETDEKYECQVSEGFPTLEQLKELKKQGQPADVLQPHIIFVQRGHLLLQVAGEQLHEEINFGLGTSLPVLFRKRIQRERRNADTRSTLDHVPDGSHSGTMSGDSRQVAFTRPPAVTVHDDCDVLWKPLRIEPLVYLGLFAIQPGRNFRLQGNPFCFRN